jgi:mycofactocin precursor
VPEAPATPLASTSSDDEAADPTLVEDTLVEEVSIDGMCGVY